MAAGTRHHRLTQWQLLPFYLGTIAGPVGGGVLPVIFAILMGAFGVDRATLSLAVPVYMFPYAAVQLISGGISDLTSRRSSILIGFGGYGAATILAGLSPNFAIFLVAQALQGAANAFMTPILMATLGDVVPPRRMGRTMGLFSTTNLVGTMLAPLIAGLLGDLSWRLLYIVIGLATWGLTLWYLYWFHRFGGSVPQRPSANSFGGKVREIAGVMSLQVVLLAALAFFANGSMRGPVYLFAEYLRARWGTGTEAAGLILATFGLAGLLAGPISGVVIERAGVFRGIAASTVGIALSLVLMGLAPSPSLFAGANFLLGVAGINAWAALNTLTVQAVPEHRGTVASVFGSSRFLAQAVSPFWFTPLYQSVGQESIFVVAAALAVVLLAPLGMLKSRMAQESAPRRNSPAAPASDHRQP